jgi:hypothetical protein
MCARFLLPLLLVVASSSADEKIVGIYPELKVITTAETSTVKLYRLAPNAQITVNGTAVTLKDLLVGQTVAVKTDGVLMATKVAASGLGRAPAANAKPPALRSVTVEVRVDGSDRIFYGDGKLWVEHGDARKPIDFVINGVEWTPNWDEMKSAPFSNFTVPVAPIGQARVAMKQLAGRGRVRLERSNAASAVVVIEDPAAGADLFAFQLSW